MPYKLELKTAFTRRVCKRLDLAVINEPAAVEYDAGYVLSQRAFGDGFADFDGCGNVWAGRLVAAEIALGCVDRGDRLPRSVVNDLRINVLA